MLPMDDDELEPGQVFEQEDIDAKLITLRMKGSPHFTGRDMEEIEAHFGKGMTDLGLAQMQTAAAFIYLRRSLGRPISWERAGEVVVDVTAEPDPTKPGSLET
jgi:hypothetical protein